MMNNNIVLKKLNLGCGKRLKEGYINCDINPEYEHLGVLQIDAANLSMYHVNEIDEIYTSHVIEHFDFNKGQHVLKEWYRVLKPGGKLIIETPDFYYSCKYFIELYEKYNDEFIIHENVKHQIYKLYGHFFSEPWKPHCYHLFLYTEKELCMVLKNTGFKKIIRKEAENFIENFPGNENIFLRVECEK